MNTILIRLTTLAFTCCAFPALARIQHPQIVNPGFEQGVAGWGWMTKARASYSVSQERPRSDKQCIVFENGSETSPHVYARLSQGVRILPGVLYELSVWSRGNDVRPGNHLTDWNSFTLHLPSGKFDWTKTAVVFRTKPDQTALNVGINIANKCSGLAIDDINLRIIGEPLTGENVNGFIVTPGRVIGDETTVPLLIDFETTHPRASKVTAVISGTTSTLFTDSAAVKRGRSTIHWAWDTGATHERDFVLRVTVEDDRGRAITSATQKVEKLGSSLSKDVNRLEQQLPELSALLQKCRDRGIDCSYPAVAEMLIQQFIPFTREDLQRGELQRADFAVKDLTASLDRALTEAQSYLRDPSLSPGVRRYVTPTLRSAVSDSPENGITINGLAFDAPRRIAGGGVSRGPVYFCGYGHFTQLNRDMDKFPQYGINIIQLELGPRHLFPTEDEISTQALDYLVGVLDNAAKHNVAVNVLLSPHNFPAWAINKWPHLAKGGGGFLGFCVDAPEAKQVVENHLRKLIPILRDKPALHSFCLTNEPILDRIRTCDDTPARWRAHLLTVHGDVNKLNDAYGTTYTAIEQVPFPALDAYAAPQFYDWCVFNQERLAGWHVWMRDIIRELAPDVPIHAKTMNMMVQQRATIGWGVDPELFTGLSDINGNDCTFWPVPNPTKGSWAADWLTQNLSYDLQRSMARQPIFNSENHLTPDRSTYYVKPEHFRAALWQGAIHGQGATTIWVWERTYDRMYDFYGNVMDRPGCAEEVGRTCYDLNRHAELVKSLAETSAPVALLYSVAAIAKSKDYIPTLERTYTALNFCGLKVDLISEKQLAQGKGNGYNVIVLAGAENVLPGTLDSLAKLPVSSKIITTGIPPAEDPYGRKLDSERLNRLSTRVVQVNQTTTVPRDLRDALLPHMREAHAVPDFSLIDLATGNQAWGVEWLSVQTADGYVINLTNLTAEPVDVLILRNSKPVDCSNLLSPGAREKVKRLEPLVPALGMIRN